jgi:FMN phosphatase YigB (HAD superfamily)
MAKVKPAISAIIFDAGDVIVHKIDDEKVEVWGKICSLIEKNNVGREDFFYQIYDEVRCLGSNSAHSEISFKLPDKTRLKIPVELINQYEIIKWWQNPDSLLEVSFGDLKRSGYRIAILTDSALPSEVIRDQLSFVSSYIDTIVSSRDVGAMKPDKRMYVTVLSKLKISPEKSLFIGHDKEELDGALSIGMYCENFDKIRSLDRLTKIIRENYIFIE